MTQDDGWDKTLTFGEELQILINTFSQDNASDTPDFILADYMLACLESYHAATRRRDKWYGHTPWGTSGSVDEAPINVDSEAR
jgi:hypothetical protein